MSEKEITIDPRLTKMIIEAIGKEYLPVTSVHDATDFFTTVDLMEIVSGFAITDIDTVTTAMIDAGFTLATIEGNPYWLMKKV